MFDDVVLVRRLDIIIISANSEVVDVLEAVVRETESVVYVVVGETFESRRSEVALCGFYVQKLSSAPASR